MGRPRRPLRGQEVSGLLTGDVREFFRRFTNDSGPALAADGLQVDGAVFLSDGFTATGAGEDGAVRLLSAHIGGQLDCSGAQLTNDSGPALAADGLQVDQDMALSDGFTATGSGDDGAIRLAGAHVGGQLDCSAARLANDTGPALNADGLQVDHSMFLRAGFTAAGAGEDGAVCLAGARVGDQLDCSGATLGNDSGPALNAEGLQVDRGMFLRAAFTATGAGEDGAVRLAAARVGGQLDCSGATLGNDTGPALNAYGLQVDQALFLRGGFTATGAGELGAAHLLGARIGGDLECDGATLRNDTGPALHADSLQVDGSMSLCDGFIATGAGDDAVVNLGGARVAGMLVFDAEPQLKHTTQPLARLELDGLTYAGVPAGIDPGDWLRLIRDGTPSYAAQPYQQLAAGHRAAGHDREARRVLMAQRRDQIRDALTSPAERAWARLTGLTLGYGYQPWRALLFLLVSVVAAVTIAVQLGAHGALIHTSRSLTPGQPCDRLERAGVGVDLGLPLIKTGARERCDITSSRTGQALTLAGWSLQLLAWAFATLFIAGFTGAVRKT